MKMNKSDCLTYEQLEAFVLTGENSKQFSGFQEHILGCELCACAVKGFTEAPFFLIEINDLQKKIDKKIRLLRRIENVKYTCIVVVSVAFSFGFYLFAGSFSRTKIVEPQKKAIIKFSEATDIKKEVLATPLKAVEKHSKRNNFNSIKRRRREFFIPEPAPNINVKVPETGFVPDNTLQPFYKQEVSYIYNLKVTNYYTLYFKRITPDQLSVKNSFPSSWENKNHHDQLENDIIQEATLDQVLKRGLNYINLEEYDKSIMEWYILLKHNPNDLNALFYSALAYKKIMAYSQAIKNFKAVLSSDNNVFYQEAKWNLALIYGRIGEVRTAKQLLVEIAGEKGFYANEAEKQLKSLNGI
jgi:hypothetical protein